MVTTSHHMICINPIDGKDVWKVKGTSYSSTSIISGDNQVFINAGSLYQSYNLTNGGKKKNLPNEKIIFLPLIIHRSFVEL